ncbi:hypothetical protein TNCV_2522301 [Trichonephila clavipes]|nr:hypothetical protein TNCV_2522301 [Trichonephila clavipes]
MIVQFRNEKVSNHGSIPITIDCNVEAFIVFEEGFHQPIKRNKNQNGLHSKARKRPFSGPNPSVSSEGFFYFKLNQNVEGVIVWDSVMNANESFLCVSESVVLSDNESVVLSENQSVIFSGNSDS